MSGANVDQGTVSGRGVFTGAEATVAIRPSEARGIILRASGGDLPAVVAHLTEEPLHPAFAGLPPRSTNLARDGGPSVGTVEHLMSALSGLGVWNATIEIEGPEAPIGDGSSLPYAEAIRSAGIEPTPLSETKPIVVHERIELTDGLGVIVAEPLGEDASTPCRMSYHLNYSDAGGAALPPQSASWDGLADSYLTEIAPARTFSLLSEVEAMRELGLFTGFSPRDLLVLGPSGPIENEWRFENEPARHKLLDLIGDLALLGGPIRGRITATRSGHALNHELARALGQQA